MLNYRPSIKDYYMTTKRMDWILTYWPTTSRHIFNLQWESETLEQPQTKTRSESNGTTTLKITLEVTDKVKHIPTL